MCKPAHRARTLRSNTGKYDSIDPIILKSLSEIFCDRLKRRWRCGAHEGVVVRRGPTDLPLSGELLRAF